MSGECQVNVKSQSELDLVDVKLVESYRQHSVSQKPVAKSVLKLSKAKMPVVKLSVSRMSVYRTSVAKTSAKETEFFQRIYEASWKTFRSSKNQIVLVLFQQYSFTRSKDAYAVVLVYELKWTLITGMHHLPC